jgi:hypothetical protein
MTRLMNLGLKAAQNESSKESAPSEIDPRPSAAIETLRRRLIGGVHADSVEVKVAVLGEMLYCCYIELQKRRHL